MRLTQFKHPSFGQHDFATSGEGNKMWWKPVTDSVHNFDDVDSDLDYISHRIEISGCIEGGFE